MSIQSFPANARIARVIPVLERDGVVIIRRIVADQVMNRLLKDIGAKLVATIRRAAHAVDSRCARCPSGGRHWRNSEAGPLYRRQTSWVTPRCSSF